MAPVATTRVFPVAEREPRDGMVKLILLDAIEATQIAVVLVPLTKLTSAPE